MGKRTENGSKLDYYFLIEKFCVRSANSASNRRFKKFCAWRNSVPTLYDRGNGITPSGELYGASSTENGQNGRRTNNLGKGKEVNHEITE